MRWLAFLSVLLCMFTSKAHGEAVYLLPEAFELQLTGGVPAFSVTLESGQPVARMVFVASYRASLEALGRTYGDKLGEVEVIRLPLDPGGFTFMAEFLNSPSLTVESVHREYFSNQVLVEVRFRPSGWSVEQVRSILQTPLLFGFVEGKIDCTRNTRHALCDRPMEGLPAANQFRSGGDTEWERRLFILNEYKNRLALGEIVPLTTGESIDVAARNKLFQGRKCKWNLTGTESEVCSLVSAHSLQHSLLEAVGELVKLAYSTDPRGFSDEIVSRILKNNLLQVSTVLSGDDAEIVKNVAGDGFSCRLRGSGRVECEGVLRYHEGTGTCRSLASWGNGTTIPGLGYGVIDVAARGGLLCGLHSGGGVSCLGYSGEDRDGERAYLARSAVRFESGIADARRLSIEPARSDTAEGGFYDFEFDGNFDERLFNQNVFDSVWYPREGSGPGDVVGCG